MENLAKYQGLVKNRIAKYFTTAKNIKFGKTELFNGRVYRIHGSFTRTTIIAGKGVSFRDKFYIVPVSNTIKFKSKKNYKGFIRLDMNSEYRLESLMSTVLDKNERIINSI